MTTTPFAPSVQQPVAGYIPGQIDPSTSMPAPFPSTGTQVVTPPSTEPTFTQADVFAAMERAREEEKNKLYGRLDEQGQVLKSLQDAETARQEEAKKLREEQEAAQRAAEEANMSAAQLVEKNRREFEEMLNQRQKSWDNDLQAEREERLKAEAVLAKERQFNEVRQYAQTKITENESNIAPQLVNWIQGNTTEEIDANVARAIETSAQLAAQFQQMQNPAAQFVAPPIPGVSTASGPANLDPAQQYQQLTLEQIADMPMADYAKLRGRLGVAGSQQNKGLYG